MAHGAEVHSLGRGLFYHSGVRHHQASLFDQSATAELLAQVRPSHVLHAAWYADHGSFWYAPENWAWVDATISLAIAARQNGVERFVGVGSVAEYDWDCGQLGPLSESARIAPSSAYGQAKVAAHEVAANILRDASFAWGRLFHVFGAGEPPGKVTSYLAREIAAGRNPHLRRPDAMFDFVDVDYAGDALAALLLSDVDGPVNIATGNGTRLRDLATIVGEYCGTETLIRSAEVSDHVPLRLVADVTRLRREIGLSPARALHETITCLCGARRD